MNKLRTTQPVVKKKAEPKETTLLCFHFISISSNIIIGNCKTTIVKLIFSDGRLDIKYIIQTIYNVNKFYHVSDGLNPHITKI